MRECPNLEKKEIFQPGRDSRLFAMIEQIGNPSMVSTADQLLRNCTAQMSFVSFNLSWVLGAPGWGSGGGGGGVDR